MDHKLHRVTPAILAALTALLVIACMPAATPLPTTIPTSKVASTNTPTPAAPPIPPTLTPTPRPTRTPRPTKTPAPTATPTPTPTPGPIEGYWIKNTTREGLCSDNPRLIGFDRSSCRAYVGGSDTTICYLGIRSLEMWPHDYPSPLVLFPSWISVDVPNLERVTAGTAFSNSPNPYISLGWGPSFGMPSFAGSNGQCIVLPGDTEPDWQGKEPQWQCFTTAEGLPFDDIQGYGIVQDSNVEWYMSADSVASKGLQPQDVSYSIPDLVGATGAHPTCLGIPEKEDAGIWVGTNGYGVIHIEPSEDITRYTAADGLPGDTVRDVVSCGVQCAWVATDGGIGHWDGTRWRAYTTRDGLPSDDVRGISPTDCYWMDGLWAATADGMLVGTPLGAIEGDGAAWVPITTAAVNDASSTTIATDKGLWVWDGDTWGQATHERTLRVAEGGWYATAGQVCRWVDGEAVCPTTPDGQPLANVTALYADPEEGIVVASDGHRQLWVYEAESDGPGHFAASATDLYLGRINDVVAAPEAWHYATEVGVYHAPCDTYGCMTMGDFNLTHAWPISVRQMSLDKTTGAIWIATSQGGFYQESVKWTWRQTYIAGLPHQDLTAVLPLPDGSAWFGTADAGLMNFEP